MLDREQLERWLFGAGPGRRLVQDSPILQDVWYAYALPAGQLRIEPAGGPPLVRPEGDAPGGGAPERGGAEGERSAPLVDLLLRPVAKTSASELARALHARLDRPRTETLLAYNEAHVACRLRFDELLRAALPLSEFWQGLWPGHRGALSELVGDRREELAAAFRPGGARVQGRKALGGDELPGDLVWLVGLVGRIAWEHRGEPAAAGPLPSAGEVVDAALELLGPVRLGDAGEVPLLWTVSRNRPVQTAVSRSRIACKADAATRVFGLSCRDVRWAVIDSGIDARHPAFAKRADKQRADKQRADEQRADEQRVDPDVSRPERSARSRIAATWDFASIRAVLVAKPLDGDPPAAAAELSLDDPAADAVQALESQVARGRAVDWEDIAPKLAVPHDERYRPPLDDHGTHVAGILAADWRTDDRPPPGETDVQGMCPDMMIYDLRAFDATGRSDEFQVLSAMQFVRHLNAHADVPVVHGVNLSFSMVHDVDKYAAGGTPVCQEADRLVGSGVVVVAAAGNDGRAGYHVAAAGNDGYHVANGVVDGYRTVSITDPGNADKVITVGSTHRDHPHTYGVSYFSSRGPTGDGRMKPDLVAPGEKITSTVPDAGLRTKDGTSQAAPHVSGACALLMARHPELIGKPDRVKEILMATCTDLGRERSFQGAGVIDVLRAIQAV